MTILHAIILGIVQGITEFLPVSSSGHLIIFPTLFNWPLQPLSFDIALHIGTLLALVIFFWHTLWNLIKKPNLVLLLIIGTIPALIAGFALSDVAENTFRSPVLVAINMIWFGVVMGVVDRFSSGERKYEEMAKKNVLVVGLMQCLALIPGTSRSGTTIVGGRLQGLSREQSAEFAFLLGIPVTFGAVVKGSFDLYQIGITQSEMVLMLGGIISSALVGIVVIKWLLKFLTTHGLMPFVIYRLVVGFGLLLIFKIHT